MRINFSDVQRNVSEIANRQVYTSDVLYELMAAYGRATASITKLRSGNLNLAEDKSTTVLQRGVVYFKVVPNAASLPAEVEKLEQDPLSQRYNPRFLIATDLKTFAAKDTKKGNTLEIAWENIDRNVDFFYGWTGDEVTDEKTEAAADRRAADKMKELYQELEKVNIDKFKAKSSDFRHHLNVFFTLLLFCFFAEDTRVFSKEDTYIFTGSIKDFTQPDGSDLDQFLSTLFESLDEEDKSKYTSPFSKFPYVNGKIFSKKFGIEIPKFNAQARKLILDCGALSWAEINPDIFGSMFQSIVDEEHRSTHGMHYTSVPNIMKTIEPLFLDELRDEFDKHYDNPKQLQKLHDRISKIKVFDPACGSGNFLIIAYKELRKLEHAIIERLFDDEHKRNILAGRLKSKIELDNFYGIEIDDFACEVAVLSLYLAKHQMNIEFEKQFGQEIKLIPLKDKANIVHGNAARVDWQEVCPNKPTKRSLITEQQEQLIVTEDKMDHLLTEDVWEEIYLIGNPQYTGSRKQTERMKDDMDFVFAGPDSVNGYKVLDYVLIWFYKGIQYIKGNHSSKLSFVSTSSICQGDQVGIFWPKVLTEVEIGYAYTAFKWSNNARDVAGVSCVIVSLRNLSKNSKTLFYKEFAENTNIISAYLTSGTSTVVHRRKKALSNLPIMSSGNYTGHAQSLMLDKEEVLSLLKIAPEAEKYIKKLMGSDELIKSLDRWCLWIDDEDLSDAIKINEVRIRIEKTRNSRLESRDPSANKLASRPHQFRDRKTTKTNSVVVPIVSSENRVYVPISIVTNDTILTNKVVAVYDTHLYVFAILSSLMPMARLSAVCGRLETRYSYSSEICYNTFPIRDLSDKDIKDLENSAKNILLVRQNYTERTLAEMYGRGRMPDDLQEAHHQNDLLVDRLYRQKPYLNNEERLADLFKLYEEMKKKKKELV